MPSQPQNSHRRLPSTQSSQSSSSRLENVRVGIQNLFTGRSTVGTRTRNTESTKTPRPVLGLPNLSHTGLSLPYLTRTPARPQASSPSRTTDGHNSPISTRSTRSDLLEQQSQNPAVLHIVPRAHLDSNERFVVIDPAERHLAELAQIGRQHRRRRNRHRDRNSVRTCVPRVKSKKARSKILSCFISGLFLTLVLTIYLALALSNRSESQEFHVLLILIILITTIFFCHSLIRLCMIITKPSQEEELSDQLPSMSGPGGYANPAMPIRVALARDEEAAGIVSEAIKLPPPAYGLWRESVRVDPNRIFWQRNEAVDLRRQNSVGRGETRPANRPPSYVSEDGVQYIMEAAPRSIAPTTDVPLLPHSSDRGQDWPRQSTISIDSN